MEIIKEVRRYEEIDFIKMLAIIAVVVQHSMSGAFQSRVYAEYWLYQAIPLFMMIAGISSALSAPKGGKTGNYLKRILFPYNIVWLIWLLSLDLYFNAKTLIISYLTGTWGVGGYFVPLYTQHILIFPAMLWGIKKLEKRGLSIGKISIFFFLISLLPEFVYYFLDLPAKWYAPLHIRHLYAVFLGVYLVRYKVKLKVLIPLATLSLIYTFFAGIILEPKFIAVWRAQHAPGYFYTMLIVISLWKLYPTIRAFGKHFLFIGRASYHIFLVQALYFWPLGRGGQNNVFTTLLICLFLGCLLEKLDRLIRKTELNKNAS